MSISSDVLLDDQFTVHLSIIPDLGLIIISELQDFADNWFEIKVVQNSKERFLYDIRTLSGDIKLQAPCRYLVESVQRVLFAPSHERISPTATYIINLGIRSEVLSDRSRINSLAHALERLLIDSCPQSQSQIARPQLQSQIVQPPSRTVQPQSHH